MKRHLPQSSPAIPATAVDSDTPENMDMDYDVIRSLNNIRDQRNADQDANLRRGLVNRTQEDSGCESHTLRITYRLGNLKIESRVRFYIIHHEDTARVTYVTDYQPDRTVEHSVDSARELYRILRRRGYYSF